MMFDRCSPMLLRELTSICTSVRNSPTVVPSSIRSLEKLARIASFLALFLTSYFVRGYSQDSPGQKILMMNGTVLSLTDNRMMERAHFFSFLRRFVSLGSGSSTEIHPSNGSSASFSTNSHRSSLSIIVCTLNFHIP